MLEKFFILKEKINELVYLENDFNSSERFDLDGYEFLQMEEEIANL